MDIVDRQCYKHAKDEKRKQQKAFEAELDFHVRNGDEAQAQQVARDYARTQRSTARAMKDFPHTRPTLDQIKGKYGSPATEGGWNADVIEPEVLNRLDISFKNRESLRPLEQKKAAAHFRHQFKKSIIKAPNRKSTQPGEIPAELWRIALQPQWLQPNYKYPWALKTTDEQPQKWEEDKKITFVSPHDTKSSKYPTVVDRWGNIITVPGYQIEDVTSHERRDYLQGACDQLQGFGMSQVPAHGLEEEPVRRYQLQDSGMSQSQLLRDHLQDLESTPDQSQSRNPHAPLPQSESGVCIRTWERIDANNDADMCTNFGTPGKIEQWFEEMTEFMYLRDTLPVQSIINEACFIPKKILPQLKETNVADCQRSIHKYNSFTQNAMRTIEKQTAKTQPRPPSSDSAFGAIKGRQREEAIFVQENHPI